MRKTYKARASLMFVDVDGQPEAVNFMQDRTGMGIYITDNPKIQAALEKAGVQLVSVIRDAKETEEFVAEQRAKTEARAEAAKKKASEYKAEADAKVAADDAAANEARKAEGDKPVVFAEVMRLAEAVRIMSDDYNIDCSNVRSKNEARMLAQKFGIDFPNLK